MGKDLHILLIEDSEDDAALLMRELRRGGYDTTYVRVDSAEALTAALTQQDWDIIISDYHMPNFDCLDALSVIKEQMSDLPFIIVSGTVTEETAVAAMRSGAHDYIMKSNLRRLIPAIERELGEAEVRRQRGQAEAALRESRERFQELAENIKEVFWLTNVEKTQMLYISPAYVHVWGRTCASLYAAPHTWVESIHVDDRDQVMDAVLSKQTTGEYDQEYRIIRPDGSIRWIWDRAFPIRDRSGTVYRIAGVAEDLTDRKSLESELRQAQKMEAVGRLAGGIAHDFNNLLTVIIGNSHLILGRARPDDVSRKEVAEIRLAGERAALLTRQLLAFSRGQVLQPQTLDLNQQVTNTEGMLRRLIREDIELVTSMAPGLGLVLADEGQIQQVIMNLVVNARDAMPYGGRITIRTSNVELEGIDLTHHSELRPGSYVMLAVSDTGIGMTAETRARLFEPFFTTKEPGKGTGLGLSTVYGIITQSKGTLHVRSELGQGTTFEILLPRDQAQGLPKPMISRLVRNLYGTETILVVEDEDALRTLIQKILEQHGYTVLVAGDGQEAMRICEAHQDTIELLFTDTVLPGMNGLEFADRVLDLLPQIKVVYASGYPDMAAGDMGLHHLKGPFIQKPFTPDVLTRVVREALDS